MTDNLEGFLWKYDTPHAGALCDLLLQKHGLRQADVALHAGKDPNRISRFINDKPKKTDMELSDVIVDIIAKHGDPGLSPTQGRALRNMIGHSRKHAVKSLEHELETISPKLLGAVDRSDSLESLVEQLRRERNPAFIMDDLWFVHAYNGASLELFGVDYNGRDKDKLRSWQAWHVIATKFTPGSIIRDAHINPNLYFRPAVNEFFKDVRIYLFTTQVRLLLQKIHEMSKRHNYGFDQMWLDAVTFRGDEFPLEGFRRTLRHPSDPNTLLEARTLPGFVREIAVVPRTRYRTKYTLVIWDGINGDAKRFFSTLGKPRQEILFASKYEDNGFHVNKWPKTLKQFELSESEDIESVP